MAVANAGWNDARHGASRLAVPLLGWERRTALVGVVATAVAFGPARMAFGMLLPSIREAFALSGSAAGLIAAATFAAFAFALVGASLLSRRYGAKLPVVIGGAAALAGAALVTIATSTAIMVVGVVLAATAAGLCWTPFNAVASRLVRERRRDRVLSFVSTGTTLGIALMALGALLLAWTGASWRWVWGATAVMGGLSAAVAFMLLPPSRNLVPRRPPDVSELPMRDMLRRAAKREACPVHALAFSFGALSAAFATFAVDHLVETGRVADGPAPTERTMLTLGGLVFLAYGMVGAVGFLSDAIERRLGLARAVAGCFLVAALGTTLLALVPASWTFALSGAGLVGGSVMVFCVLLSVATLRLFPLLPVMGFTVAVLAMSIGSIAGPAVVGMVADGYGTTVGLLLVAGLAGLTGLATPLAMRSGTLSHDR